MPATCRYCDAEILWVVMVKSQRKRPLDIDAKENGTVWLDAGGQGHEISTGGNVFVNKFRLHDCRKR